MGRCLLLFLLFAVSANLFSGACLTTSVVTKNNLQCYGGNNGSITVTVVGGTNPYTYFWSNGQSAQTASGLSAGTYTCTVIDAGSCRDSILVNIFEPDSITAAVIVTEASCGKSNGTATITGAGGTDPFTYSWSNGDSANSITDLAVAVYTLTLTDSKGCTNTTSTSIVNLPGPKLSIYGLTDASCFGGSNGSATVGITGGTPDYTYEWSTGLTGANAVLSDTLKNIPAAAYAIRVSDANGCLADTTFSIHEPTLLISDAVSANGTCGLTNGSASVSVSGGIPIYTYSWSNGISAATSSLSSQILNLGSAIYSVTVTDNNGCTSASLVSLDNAIALSLIISAQQDISCNGLSDGSATVTVTSGTPAFSYSWSAAGGPTTPTCSGLSTGNYTVTVSDNSACMQTTSITITEPFLLSSGISQTNASCGINDGIVNASASGGSSPYKYLWSNSSTEEIAANLSAGSYTVTITDSKGCTTTSSSSITNNSSPVSHASAVSSTILEGNTTSLVGSGGVTYQWIPGSSVTCSYCSNTMASPLVTTTYSLIATDGFGCSDTSQVTITVEPDCTGEDKDVFIANVFSPNGDGKNDEIKVEGNGLERITWSVFDRWGNRVFYTEHQTEAWDGTDRGKPLNNGTYIYILQATCKTNLKEITLKGTINILK